MKQGPLVVDILRGKIVESSHLIDAVVLDSKNQVIAEYGDSQRPVFPRSAIKMIQAIPFVESGAAEHFQLSEDFLALACGSHQGEEQHTVRIKIWLEKLGKNENILACGPHYPFDEIAKFSLIQEHLKPSRIHNNCSGKHCGIISTSIFLKENPSNYQSYDHPAQVRLRNTLTRLSGINFDQAPWGIDGCGIPTYAVPLMATTRALNNIFQSESGLKILNAVKKFPEMISGSHGFCSEIIKKSLGKSIAKGGAEGVYSAFIPEAGVSFALKTRDGAHRAAELSTIFLLSKFGGLSESQTLELQLSTSAIIKNWAGDKVGISTIRPS